MPHVSGWTRRQALGGAIGAALAARPALSAPALVKGSKLTFWGGLIFSDKANKLLADTVRKWGADNGIQAEVVMINQNETVQKVSAAIASNTMPDALDMGLDLLLLLSKQGQFLPVDDIFEAVGKAQGGWYPAAERATDTRMLTGGVRTGLPFGISGNLLLRRHDLLSKAGFAKPPATWDELVRHCVAVNKPPFHALGFALSNVGDGNTMIGVMQSFGGRIADDSGTTAAIKSDDTRAFLRWVKDAWDKKLFPPGVTTWDGAGDNNAYLSGQTAFIANTGSVGIAARTQDPELFRDTLYSALPAGPKRAVSPTSPNVRAIHKSSKNPDAARALLEHLAQPEFLSAYYADAIYGPVTKDQAKFKVFDGQGAIHAGLLDLVQNGTAPGQPDLYNTAFAEMWNNFVVPKMIQRVVIDGWDLDRSMDEAQRVTQAIYDKHK